MLKNTDNKRELRFVYQMNYLARTLRDRPTAAEVHLWKYLRKNRLSGYKFRRQHAIGKYIVDFICTEKKLVVEVDGPAHAFQKDYDQQRDLYLLACGYRTLRFINEEVFNNTKDVLRQIAFS